MKKKVLITGVSGIVGSSAYMLMSKFPEQYELYGLGRRRALSERVFDGRDIAVPERGTRSSDHAIALASAWPPTSVRETLALRGPVPELCSREMV